MESNLEKIKSMFDKIQENGWDIMHPLKWGFFFVSREEEKLKQVYEELKNHGYILESIHQPDNITWVLQVSKIETLVPEKLHRRNISFNDLASIYDSEYDGWDVGKQ
jgi:hypothetical protein